MGLLMRKTTEINPVARPDQSDITMRHVPPDLYHRLREHGQEHVLAFWDQLTPDGRARLVEQLAGVDLQLIQQLYARRDQRDTLPDPAKIQPLPIADQADLGPDDVARDRKSVV